MPLYLAAAAAARWLAQASKETAQRERCAVVQSIPSDQHILTSWKSAPGQMLVVPVIEQAAIAAVQRERLKARNA